MWCGNIVGVKGAREKVDGPDKPPIKLSVQFSYGEERIESFVSNLSRMGLVSERMIEGTAQSLSVWLKQLLVDKMESRVHCS